MLVLKHIYKKYNSKKVISNLSYAFNKGKIYSIVAISGKGKTTLLRLIAKEDKEYEGEILYYNHNIKELNNYNLDCISYVYQSYQLFDDLTVIENILLPIKIADKNTNIYQNKINYLLRYFHMLNKKDQKVRYLSGGEKQRIALIRAFIKDSPIILLDEPTSALDDDNTALLFDYLNKIKEEKIILMVTHNVTLASKADEILDLSKYLHKEESNIIEKEISNKKYLFNSIKEETSIIFKSKKIYSYIEKAILSMGLIGIAISILIKSFIQDVSYNQLKNIDTKNYVTFQSIPTSNKENLSFLDENVIIYQGIEPTLKEKVKKESIIEYADFNLYDIEEKDFIFDNYVNTNNSISLGIPASAKDYVLKDDNFVTIYYQEESIKIKIEEIYISEDNHFYLYCNHVNYLYSYFNKIGTKCVTSTYLFTSNSEELYSKAKSNKKYNNYTFTIVNENMILVTYSNIPRISKKEVEEITTQDGIEFYVLGDNKNIYVDFDSGFIYYLGNHPIQVSIDNSLNKNEIGLSLKASSNEKYNYLSDSYQLSYVSEEKNYDLVYMSANTLISLIDEECIYNGIFYTSDIDHITKNQSYAYNTNLFSIDSLEVFSYISIFLSIFSIIIIIFAFISFIIIFSINFSSKKKDYLALKRLGVYESKIKELLIKEPLENVIEVSISSSLSSIALSFLLSYSYYFICNESIAININLKLAFLLFIIPIGIVIIILFIYYKKTEIR